MQSSLLLFLIFIRITCFAQQIVSSDTAIESCQDSANCYTVKGFSYLFYDESKDGLFLKLMFVDFKIEGDTSKVWLNNPTDSTLYVKLDLSKDQFPVLSNQNIKSLPLKGQIFYNAVWRELNSEVNFYSSENGIINTGNTNQNFKYDNYKLNFSFPFIPTNFKVYKNPSYTHQTLTIHVSLGRINLLKSGTESLLQDIYYQPQR